MDYLISYETNNPTMCEQVLDDFLKEENSDLKEFLFSGKHKHCSYFHAGKNLEKKMVDAFFEMATFFEDGSKLRVKDNNYLHVLTVKDGILVDNYTAEIKSICPFSREPDYYGIFYEGNLIGSCALNKISDEKDSMKTTLSDVFIQEEWRNLGFGSYLIQKTKEVVFQKKERISVVVSYSFDPQVTVFLFDDYETACGFIQEDFKREKQCDKDNNFKIDKEVTKCGDDFAILGTIYPSSGKTETTKWVIAETIDREEYIEKIIDVLMEEKTVVNRKTGTVYIPDVTYEPYHFHGFHMKQLQSNELEKAVSSFKEDSLTAYCLNNFPAAGTCAPDRLAFIPLDLEPNAKEEEIRDAIVNFLKTLSFEKLISEEEYLHDLRKSQTSLD